MRKQVKDVRERIEKEKTEVGRDEKTNWQTAMSANIAWFSASCCGL